MNATPYTRRLLPGIALQAFATFACVFVILRLWRMDLRVPIDYWGDTLFQLILIKSIANGGWIWFIDNLGAPFGLAIGAFPQNLTTTSIFVKALTFFSHEPGTLLNGYWLLMIVLTSVNAFVALCFLGFRQRTSLALATLYALLPYAFYRHTAHLPLVYPFVAVLGAFAVQVASGSAAKPRRGWLVYVGVCAAAQGFDYIYYVFFSVFFFLVAIVVAVTHQRSYAQARRAAIVVGILLVSAGLNLAPSLVQWAKYGKPPNTSYKNPVEAEVFGLKIRQLLSPVQPSYVPAVHDFEQREAQFPNENENQTVRLGTVVSIGFLGLFWVLMFAQRPPPLLKAAAILMIAGVLLATVGGFGAVFNLLVAPDIRAYNRIAVFIAFFSLLFLGYAIEWANAGALDSSRSNASRTRMRVAWVLTVSVFAFALLDQSQSARPISARYASDSEAVATERTFVAEIESKFPSGVAIMQLPETLFPPDPGYGKMGPYDHARPFLWSSRLSWSWPSFSLLREAWYQRLGTPAGPAFLDNLVLSGFSGVWVDRWGYLPDELDKIERALTARAGSPMVGGLNQRYAFFDLSPLQRQFAGHSKEQLQRDADAREWLLYPLTLSFGEGFYGVEQGPERTHRWAQKTARLQVRNDGANSRTAVFRTWIQPGQAGVLVIEVSGRPVEKIAFAATQSKSIGIPLNVPAGKSVEITLSFDGPQFLAKGDPRTLYFDVIDSRLSAT